MLTRRPHPDITLGHLSEAVSRSILCRFAALLEVHRPGRDVTSRQSLLVCGHSSPARANQLIPVEKFRAAKSVRASEFDCTSLPKVEMAGRCVNSPVRAQEVSAPMRHDSITGGPGPSVASERTPSMASATVAGSDATGGLLFSELAGRYLSKPRAHRSQAHDADGLRELHARPPLRSRLGQGARRRAHAASPTSQ
jgi:hypothetical protein